MKSYFILWLALILPWVCNAQISDTRVYNASGFDLSVSNSSITVSIGEPAILTLGSEAGMITQGYLQPNEIPPCTSVAFSYYPNPATEQITIETIGCDNQINAVQVVDIWGRLITTISPKEDNSIYVGDLSQGLYVFKVLLSGGTTGSFSAIKVSN